MLDPRARAWIEAGGPLVVTRQNGVAGALRERVALGLALPGRVRIALALPRAALARIAPPPALAECIAAAPPRWRAPLAELDARAKSAGIMLRVFGSLAWQALCGLRYVDAASDVDLLWRPATRAQVEDGVAMLRDWERTSGIRADGEIVFGDDDAVAWREWAERDRAGRLLAKRLGEPVLRTPSELLRSLERARAESSPDARRRSSAIGAADGAAAITR
jgi:phosphoribosyl-dephospho-CoA transferase